MHRRGSALIGVYLLLAFSAASCTGSDETTAFVMCQQYVKDRLRAPATADFPLTEYSTRKLSPVQFEIRSYVDSENGFGAKIRARWTCRVKSLDSSGDSWELIDIQFDRT
jgi:hypothetical protein